MFVTIILCFLMQIIFSSAEDRESRCYNFHLGPRKPVEIAASTVPRSVFRSVVSHVYKYIRADIYPGRNIPHRRNSAMQRIGGVSQFVVRKVKTIRSGKSYLFCLRRMFVRGMTITCSLFVGILIAFDFLNRTNDDP